MDSVAETITAKITGSRDRFWHVADFPGSQSRVLHVLADLVKQDELRHIRKGLYWRGVKTPLGMSPPAPEALLTQIVGSDGVGPSGLSAAHALRLSTQVPRRPEYAIPGRVPANMPGMTVRSRSARWKRREAKLWPTEVALLEVLERWGDVIEVSDEEAMTRLRRTVASGQVRPSSLRAAAETEPSSVRERLGQLLIGVA